MPSRVQPRSSISGQATSSSPRPVSSQVAVDAVERGIVRRAGGPGEVVEAQPQREGPPDPLAAAQPPGDPVDQAGEQRVELRRGPCGCPARPIAHCEPIELRRRPTSTGRGSRRLASAHRCRPGGLADRGGQLELLAPRELADGADPVGVQLGGGDRADAPEPLDRQRVQELLLAVGRHQEQPVGLADGAGHLGEVLGAGDADRDRQPDLVAHPLGAARRRSSRAPRPAGAARRRRGTPRRSRCPRPAAWCRRRSRRPRGWPRRTPRTAAARPARPGTAAAPAARPSPSARRTPWPRSSRRAPRRRRRSPGARAAAGRRAARRRRRTSRGRRAGCSPSRCSGSCATPHDRTCVRSAQARSVDPARPSCWRASSTTSTAWAGVSELVDGLDGRRRGSRSASGASRRSAPARRPAPASLAASASRPSSSATDSGKPSIATCGVRDRVAAATRPLVRRPEERVERRPDPGRHVGDPDHVDDGGGVVAGGLHEPLADLVVDARASTPNCSANAATGGDSSSSSCTPERAHRHQQPVRRQHLRGVHRERGGSAAGPAVGATVARRLSSPRL